MAASKFDICNQALRHVSARTITSFSDGTAESDQCDEHYEATLLELLQEYPWNWAAALVSMTSTTAVDGWTYAFSLPNDFVRQIWVASNSNGLGSATFPRERRGRLILTDSSVTWLRYVYKHLDTQHYPPNFEQALAYRLASKFAPAIKRSNTSASAMFDKAEMHLGLAKSADAMEEPFKPHPESSWVTSRYGYGWGEE